MIILPVERQLLSTIAILLFHLQLKYSIVLFVVPYKSSLLVYRTCPLQHAIKSFTSLLASITLFIVVILLLHLYSQVIYILPALIILYACFLFRLSRAACIYPEKQIRRVISRFGEQADETNTIIWFFLLSQWSFFPTELGT